MITARRRILSSTKFKPAKAFSYFQNIHIHTNTTCTCTSTSSNSNNMRVCSTALSLLLATCRTSAFGSLSRNLPAGTNTCISNRSSCSKSKVGHPAFTAASATATAFTRNSRNNIPMSLSLLRGGETTRNSSTSTPSSVALNSAVSSETEESAAPIEYFRSDYEPLPNVVSKINMNFDIRDGKTVVTSEMKVELNPNNTNTNTNTNTGDKVGDLVLDGDETAVKLMKLQLNDKDLVEGDDYEIKPGQLIIKGSSLYDGESKNKSSTLKTVVEIVPEENTQLSGLYKSGPMYCTQCEAMGFRR